MGWESGGSSLTESRGSDSEPFNQQEDYARTQVAE